MLSLEPNWKVADTAATKLEEARVKKEIPPYTTKQTALLCVGWGVLCSILSIPSAMYAASKSIPSDNTIGINLSVLEVFAAMVSKSPSPGPASPVADYRS